MIHTPVARGQPGLNESDSCSDLVRPPSTSATDPKPGSSPLSLPLLVPRVGTADDVDIAPVPLTRLPSYDLKVTVPHQPIANFQFASRGRRSPCGPYVGGCRERGSASTYLAMFAPPLDRAVDLHTPCLILCQHLGGRRGYSRRSCCRSEGREDSLGDGSGRLLCAKGSRPFGHGPSGDGECPHG